MANRSKEEERQRLAAQIAEWNSNRLDLFEITSPNEKCEFYGVMRFFFQDADSKVATKCIRVASDATSKDVVGTLVEKFRPDMRMLTMPNYSLYEVHANGEERRLSDLERPLLVQLNWGKDDREGRFLLRNEDYNKNIPVHADHLGGTTQEGPTFKRKLSKREKKELKKKEKEAKSKGKENEKPAESVAEKLYTDMPDTSFTRTISNPEVVMRRRRQQKLEKKLQEIRSKDDQGGTLKIYGESISPDVPYKTLLLSSQDTAEYVVEETLNKYGLEKEDPTDYCLIQVLLPPGSPEYPGMAPNQQMYILDEEDCPLAILMQFPPNKGTVMFQLKKRTADMPRSRRKKKPRTEKQQEVEPRGVPLDKQPFLGEINPDGTEPKKGIKHILPLDLMEVGSDKSVPMGPHFLKLVGPDVHPRHCVIAHSEGIVTITPAKPEAETYVNQKRITETTMLHHGMVVSFGRMQLFRFIDPLAEEKRNQPPPVVSQDNLKRSNAPPGSNDPNFETTFDADGYIETKGSPVDKEGFPGDILPASLEYVDDGEDAFLSSVIPQVNGDLVVFKLAPTYSLYMALRYRLRRAQASSQQREKEQRVNRLIEKIADCIHQTVQDYRSNARILSFWMANSSELLHFIKVDRDLSHITPHSQDILAESVQLAFQYLVSCLQKELQTVMMAFLDESTDDLKEEQLMPSSRGKPNIGDVLQVLSNAMSLLRRCRVNAALTIQLFSQLFHFVNMWLFNRLVTEPHLHLCTSGWGHRLKRRLGRVEIWAEKQGLELAADCHLSRIIQAAHLLEAPKGTPDDILSICSTCFKLNSLQLRALLENYIPGHGEPRIQPELIARVVGVAQSTADELTRSDGRDVRLEEEPDLQLPFLLPEDGYSCDIVKGVPNGLAEFLEPIVHTGVCRMTINQNSKGLWTAYMGHSAPQQGENAENLRAAGGSPGEMGPGGSTTPLGKEPEIMFVAFNKVSGSMGLSIVAAKGEGQIDRGIYIKSVVPGGAAAKDGRLQAGDQLLEVDGKNLIGLTQEKAAEHMTKTGQRVQLKVAKQGAIYHGLATMLNQPSPVMQRASPGGHPAMTQSPVPMKSRPKSEDVSRFGGPGGEMGSSPHPPHVGDPYGGRDAVPGQKPLHMQHGARSSPSIGPGRPQDQMRGGPSDGYDSYRGPQPMDQYGPQDPRSKSVSNLNRQEFPQQQDPRQNHSMGTLPRNQQPYSGGPRPMQQQHTQNVVGPSSQELNRHVSQPELSGRREEGPANDYENYPQPAGSRQGDPRQAPDYVNHRDIRAQGSQSMYNLRGAEDPRGMKPPEDMNNHNRVREWQHRNEMANQQRDDQWGPGQPGQYNSLPRDPAQRQQGRMQQQQGQGRPQEQQQQGPQDHHQQRAGPSSKQQNYPPSSSQGNFAPNTQVPTGPQAGYGPYPGLNASDQHATYQNVPQGQVPQNLRLEGMQRDRMSPLTSRGQEPANRKTVSPDLPPPPEDPPELPPPPEDLRNSTNAEDLPPPPPQIYNNDPRMGQGDPRFMQPSQKVPPPSYHQQPQNYNNYQNLPPASSVPPTLSSSGGMAGGDHRGGQYSQAPPSQYPQSPSNSQQPQAGTPQQYPYQPRPAPAGSQSASTAHSKSNNMASVPQQQQSRGPEVMRAAGPPKKPESGSKKAPPIAAKPKINLAAEIKKSLASPWEREEKERENKRREEEVRINRDSEVRDLESRPHLGPEEQERLKRLRFEQEFDKRAQEASNRTDDEDDIEERPAVRVKMLRAMQEDMEKKRQQKAEEKKKQEEKNLRNEQEKQERMERRLRQMEVDREEQRQRQMKEQERRAKENEELFKRQRELREIQRREFEEQKRLIREEERRIEEKRMEEVRLKRVMEKEQMRDMQTSRENEEQTMRREMDRMQLSDNRNPNNVPGNYPPPPHEAPNKFAPAPPERKSSYDVYRSGSNSNLPGSMYDTSRSAGPSRKQDLTNVGSAPAKKSVSFDTNLATEIEERQRHLESVSSDGSYMNYPPNHVPSPVEGPGGQHYPYRGDSTSSSEPPTPLYQPKQKMPPTSQYNNNNSQQGGPPASTQYMNNPSQNQQPSAYHPRDQGPVGYQRNYPPSDPQAPPLPQSQPPPSHYQPNSGEFHGGRPPLPAQYQNGPPYQGTPQGSQYSGPGSSSYPGGIPGSPHQQPPQSYQGQYNSGPNNTVNSPYNQGPPPIEQQQQRTPSNSQPPPTLVVSESTPGVVGANEVYRDPRDRMLASKQQQQHVGNGRPPQAERMSFRDKMKMFASEIGENTPPDRSKSSRVQQRIDSQLKSP